MQPEKREFVLEIPMHDEIIGDYVQVVRFEALVSLQRFVEMLKEMQINKLTSQKNNIH